MLTIFVLFMVFLAVGVPIAYSMILPVFLFYLLNGQGQFLPMISQRMGNSLDSFTLLAVPLFLLAGNLMLQSGMADRLTKFALAIMGRTRGGIAQASVVANIILAGISGSATADAAATGSVFIPLLRKAGYGRAFSASVISAASMIGPIIPPSIIMVIYAGLANESVGRLLLGGVVPGLLMGAFLMITIRLVTISRNYPVGQRQTFREIGRSAIDALMALLMPVLMLGGLFSGFYTATEGAAIGVLYALVVGIFIYRSLTWDRLKKAFFDTFITNGVVMFFVAASTPVEWFLTVQGANDWMLKWLAAFGNNIGLLWTVVVVIILLLGIFIEGIPILVLTIPVLVPPLLSQGADPTVIGLVFVLTAMLGSLSPPVGVSMFLVCRLAECSVAEFTREIWPYMLALVLVVVAVIIFPDLVTFLPNLFLKK